MNRIIKIITLTIISAAGILGIVFVPKQIITEDLIFRFATTSAVVNDTDVVFYKHKVYATQEILETKFEQDTASMVKEFRKNNDVLLVMLNGNGQTTNKNDYIISYSESVPDCNVEYYIVKNSNIANSIIPCRTIIVGIKDVGKKINTVYLVITMFFEILVQAIVIPQLIVNSAKYKKEKKEKINE